MTKTAPVRHPHPSEQGYVLLMVIFLLALLTLSLAVALPKISKQIQRDHELETMQRGKQYIRGVKLYYKKFGAYPPNMDALLKGTNNIRFLRKKYADPTTGKEDWKPVLFGQNKAPTAMGFFGKPLTGSTVAGIGPSGGNSVPGNGLNTTTQTPTTDPNNPSATTSTTASTSTSSTTGQTFGGAGIIGFSPNSPKQSIMIYKTKTHYNEWEFVYDPLAEQMMMNGGNAANGAGLNGQPANNNSPISNSPIGSPNPTSITPVGSSNNPSTP
jgi:type II secretory pathway pseudopilin PulG